MMAQVPQLRSSARLRVLLDRSQEQVTFPVLHPEAHLLQGGVICHTLSLQSLQHLLVLHVVLHNVPDSKNSPLAYDWRRARSEGKHLLVDTTYSRHSQ